MNHLSEAQTIDHHYTDELKRANSDIFLEHLRTSMRSLESTALNMVTSLMSWKTGPLVKSLCNF